MSAFSPNMVSSTIFGVRNVEKGNDGHIVRYAVAAGQAKKLVDYVTTLDNTVGKTAKAATDALGVASEGSIFLKSCGKVAEFSSTHINPLIVASAIYDIANSDKKFDTTVVSASALGAMFTGEHFLKKYLPKVGKMKVFENIASVIGDVAKSTKYGKFIAPVLEGLAFTAGSMISYGIGEQVGKSIIGKNKEYKA